jgi:hypothetical protein
MAAMCHECLYGVYTAKFPLTSLLTDHEQDVLASAQIPKNATIMRSAKNPLMLSSDSL